MWLLIQVLLLCTLSTVVAQPFKHLSNFLCARLSTLTTSCVRLQPALHVLHEVCQLPLGSLREEQVVVVGKLGVIGSLERK